MNNNHEENDQLNVETLLGDGQATLGADDLEGGFRVPDHVDTTRLLITAPKDTKDMENLFMRSRIPNNKVILAMAGLYQKNLAHNYKGGQDFVRFLLAGLPANRGERAQLVSNTLIGQMHHKAGVGAWQKLKDWWNPKDGGTE